MELFPQSTQAGDSVGHDNQRSTSLISTNEEESISQEVVIISDDGSEDPRSTKEGGESSRIRRRRCVSRRRWTLSEDCKLVEVVASQSQKFMWKTIATRLPHRTGNSCRLRWIKLFKPEDAFTENRWAEMAMMMGDHVLNQWRLMIAQNTPNFYAFISANHPLKRSCVQNHVELMITNPSVGGDDLSLSLGTGHNPNSTSVAIATAATTNTTGQQWPPLYDFL